ncbi:hypothetical protein [Nonomuraea cavernae]|uniref:hypothetical protein n=1 Tax=Nonomuraea cavernae TaxID=2045107 RepID=UPI001669F9A3|nr:hypothetical protein [Nonomuraea cavernae]MCA2183767.1 hypothetical protein [Nonomuraea cavernae]
MTTEVRRPAPRRTRTVVAAAVALAVLAGAALVVHLHLSGRQELRARLTDRVTALLERASPAEHHEHGHEFGPDAGRVVCAVDVFGTDPADAGTVAEVTWVYAHHMCAITGPGAGWSVSVRASGPIAVRLGTPDRVRVPQSGAGYPERVRELIPERYHDEAFGGFGDEDAIEAARERFVRATR